MNEFPTATIIYQSETLPAYACAICPGNLKFTSRESYVQHSRIHGPVPEPRRCVKCKAVYSTFALTRRFWRLCEACDAKRRAKMGRPHGVVNRTHRAAIEFNENIPMFRRQKKEG